MTKEDLEQIRAVVQAEIKPVDRRIDVLQKEIQIGFQEVKANIANLAKGQEQIIDTVTIIFQTVGEHTDKLTKRIEKIEDHLEISHKN